LDIHVPNLRRRRQRALNSIATAYVGAAVRPNDTGNYRGKRSGGAEAPPSLPRIPQGRSELDQILRNAFRPNWTRRPAA